MFSTDTESGFDAIIGNPPWDRMKLQEVEWFAERRPEIAMATKAADRKKLIADLQKNDDPLWLEYCQASENAEIGSKVARQYGDYPLLSGGDINLYSLFVERASQLVKPTGIVGLITPSGIAADLGAAAFFRTLTTPIPTPTSHSDESQNLKWRREPESNHEMSNHEMLNQVQHDSEMVDKKAGARLAALFDFENKKVFFPDVHASFKFCALVFGGAARSFAVSRCAFYLHHIDELEEANRILHLSAADFMAVNPNTGAAPIFRTARDAEITTSIYRRQPVLVDKRNVGAVCGREADLSRLQAAPTKATPIKVWPVRYLRMFDMTNDSHLFMRHNELQTQGWYPIGANKWKKADAETVPLYEGKMVQMYDHRAASVVVNEENLHRPAQQEATTEIEHAKSDYMPTHQFWVAKNEVEAKYTGSWVFGFKEISAPTNIRTMIACIAPAVGFGNKLPLFLPEVGSEKRYVEFAPLLLANFNSFAFDFILRQKIQGQTLNLFIVEQLPLIKPEQFEHTLGKTKIADFIRSEVLHLTYTAHDLAPFARDMGYVDNKGDVKPPIVWNATDRLHRQCRLDALFFNLYGINRDDAAYILDQFPIVARQNQAAHGRYLTKELILAYMNAVKAGDFTTVIKF